MTTKNYDSMSNSDLVKFLGEVEKFKEYIAKNSDTSSCINPKDLLSNNNMTLFGVEIFQFWWKAVQESDNSKDAFFTFADSISIPVRDRDINDLSWFGKAVYAVWCEALSLKNH